MKCGAIHPEHPEVRCQDRGTLEEHIEHWGYIRTTEVEWANEDYVEPAKRERTPADDINTQGDIKKFAKDIPEEEKRRPIDTPKVVTGRNHPKTSHDAAKKALPRSGSMKRLVFDLVERLGDFGATDDEIEIILELVHQTASARRNDLVRDGWLVDSGRRRPTRSGSPAIVWVVAEPVAVAS